MSPERLAELQARQRSRRNGQLWRWKRQQHDVDARYQVRAEAVVAADIERMLADTVDEDELARMMNGHLMNAETQRTPHG